MKRTQDAMQAEWLAFVRAYPQYQHNCELKEYFFKEQFMQDYHRFKQGKKATERALRELD